MAEVCQVRVAPAFLAIFAACADASTARTEPAWASVVASPLAREASIDVTPGELGDDAVVDRMRHRVRLKRIGRARLGVDASPITDRTRGDDEEPVDQLLPVTRWALSSLYVHDTGRDPAHPVLEACAAGRHRR